MEALELRSGAWPSVPYLRGACEATAYRLSGPTARSLRLWVERWQLTGPFDPFPERMLAALRVEESATTDHEYFLAGLIERLGFAEPSGGLFEAGLRLLGLAPPGAPLPPSLFVAAGDRAVTAALKTLGAQGYRMRAYTGGTLQDLDPEFLHDLRVATRRARAALRTFGPLLEARGAVELRGELRWIAEPLGRVRDLDVLSQGLPVQLDRSEAPGAFRRRLAAALGGCRKEVFGLLAKAMQSDRYRELVETLACSAPSGPGVPKPGPPPWRPPQEHPGNGAASPLPFREEAYGQSVQGFAVRSLGRAMDRIRAGLHREPGALDPPSLHRLRIRFKRLRYACEFFRPLLGRGAGPVLKTLQAFQQCLGEYQDARFALEFLAGLPEVDPGLGQDLAHALCLGSLLQVQRELMRCRRSDLESLWGKGPDMLKRLRGLLRGLETDAGGKP